MFKLSCLYTYIHTYIHIYIYESNIEEEKDDFDPLTQMHKDAVHKIYDQYKKEKDDQNPMKGKKIRETKFTKIAKNVLGGSYKQLKTEVITCKPYLFILFYFIFSLKSL